ncbi:hypothetical protein RJ55_01857 [Drechmeria coniospora]|nr:hypothetical protein RJ55_01857 [Drechmeria coniospora]
MPAPGPGTTGTKDLPVQSLNRPGWPRPPNPSVSSRVRAGAVQGLPPARGPYGSPGRGELAAADDTGLMIQIAQPKLSRRRLGGHKSLHKQRRRQGEERSKSMQHEHLPRRAPAARHTVDFDDLPYRPWQPVHGLAPQQHLSSEAGVEW